MPHLRSVHVVGTALALSLLAGPVGRVSACGISEPVPGQTLLATPLRTPQRPPARQAVLEQDLRIAEAGLRIAPDREDPAIWVARRLGYLDRNENAIAVIDTALARFPDSYKLLRFRGQFKVRQRRFDEAIADYRRGIELAAGHADTFEPDGIINPRNEFIGSYRSNLHYYLAQAYWAKGLYQDTLLQMLLANAHPLSHNDDRRVSSAYWQYLALKRMGRNDEADALSAAVPTEADLLENHGYHQSMLYFSGRLSAEELLAKPDANMRFAHAMALDFAGNRQQSLIALRQLVDDTATGFWPAETEILRMTDASCTR